MKFFKAPCANAFFTPNCYTGLDHFVIWIKHGLIRMLGIKKQRGLVSNGNLEIDAIYQCNAVPFLGTICFH